MAKRNIVLADQSRSANIVVLKSPSASLVPLTLVQEGQFLVLILKDCSS